MYTNILQMQCLFILLQGEDRPSLGYYLLIIKPGRLTIEVHPKHLCRPHRLVAMALVAIQKFKLTTLGNALHSIGMQCEFA